MNQNVTAQRTVVEPAAAVDAAELGPLTAWIARTVFESGTAPTLKFGPRGAGKTTWAGPIQPALI